MLKCTLDYDGKGNWRMNNTMQVDTTAPTLAQGVNLGQGAVFVPASSGPLHPWLFGTVNSVSGTELDSFLAGSSEWATYLVSSLSLETAPVVGPGAPRSEGNGQRREGQPAGAPRRRRQRSGGTSRPTSAL